jgi:hypothetical protein
MREIRIFVASPGDVAEERSRVRDVADELNRTVGADREMMLTVVGWESHAWPGFGEDAQDVINAQIGPYDIFIGVIWRRVGTPTHRSVSGTVEEFERAYETWQAHGRPTIMFYFRTTPYSPTPEDAEQLPRVFAFRELLKERGALWWEYDSPDDFERNVREHLQHELRGMQAAGSAPTVMPAVETSVDKLLHLIPDALRSACRPIEDAGGGVSAAVTCYPSDGPTEIRYYQYFNRAAMYEHYGFWIQPQMGVQYRGRPDGHPLLVRDSGRDHPYENSNGSGRRYLVSLGTGTMIMGWTNDDLLIHAEAHFSETDPTLVWSWWESPGGGFAAT